MSFGRAADNYDRVRPTYPQAAIAWALGTEPLTVVDLGAGTGILTRVLRALGHDVIPVEPDAHMRARLESVTLQITALDATAERIPVPNDSVDAVMAGQAYHWFNTERAHAEIARVLKPGGIFAPIWNVRDESVGWVSELTAAAELSQDGSAHISAFVDTFGPGFGQPERAVFSHSTTLTTDMLVTLVRSRSHYLTSTPEHQAELDAAVRELAAEHPDIAGRESFELPYLTYVYRARYER